MQASDYSRFEELMQLIVDKYPNAKVTENMIPAYWDELKMFPFQAVQYALETAPGSSPTFLPPAPMIRQIADRESRRLGSVGAQLALEQTLPSPPVRPDRTEALNQFYKLVDDTLSHNLNGNIDDIWESHGYRFVGVLIAMAATFGIAREKIAGDQNAETRTEKASLARAIVSTWKRDKREPYSIVRGLRKVPSTFARFPTVGMMNELIRGLPLEGWPHDYLFAGREGHD